jgi:hypothetical protein
MAVDCHANWTLALRDFLNSLARCESTVEYVSLVYDGVLEKRFEQRFPLDLALYKNPLLLLLLLLLVY